MGRRPEALAARLGLERHSVKECCEQGCRLVLPRIKNHAIIKADSAIRGRKACDCVVFFRAANALNVVIVELKSSRLDYSSIKEKFDNTLECALEWARALGLQGRPRIRMILLAKSFKHTSSFRTLKKYKWRIGGKKHALEVRRCGHELSL